MEQTCRLQNTTNKGEKHQFVMISTSRKKKDREVFLKTETCKFKHAKREGWSQKCDLTTERSGVEAPSGSRLLDPWWWGSLQCPGLRGSPHIDRLAHAFVGNTFGFEYLLTLGFEKKNSKKIFEQFEKNFWKNYLEIFEKNLWKFLNFKIKKKI